MICTSCLLKGIPGMQFSIQIWTRESQAACLAHKKHVQIVGNSKIYFTILLFFYHHIVALRCVAARACAKQNKSPGQKHQTFVGAVEKEDQKSKM